MLGSALRKGITISRIAAEDRARLGRFMGDNARETASGVSVSPAKAMLASSVYTAVTLTADTMGAMPIRFIANIDSARTPVTPRNVSALTGPKANADQTLQDLIQTINMSLDLWGEAFIYPRRTNGGDVLELWPLDPDRVTEIDRIEDGDGMLGLRFRVDGWKQGDGWIENRPGKPVELIHIKLNTLPGRIRGLSPIAMQAELIGMSLSAQEHAARFLGEGVHMSGTIETPAELDPDEARELWDGFQLSHAGPKKAGRVGVLTAGATFKTISIPPNELQFLEQMKYADQKIGAIYKAPPHLMGDVERSTSWGAGIEEQTNNGVKFALLNRARKIETPFEAALMEGQGVAMRFAMNGLLRGVAKDRAEFYRILWNLGVLTQNDIRGFEDMAPIDGGDQVFVPLNMAPLGSVPEAQKARVALMAELIGEGR